MIDITDMSNAELAELKQTVDAEAERRALLDNGPAMLRNLNQQVLNAEGVAMDDPWRQPTGAHDAYPEGWTSTYDGELWESLVNGNTHRPGESGWRRVSEDGGPVLWTQPAGAHDAYAEGDRVIWPEGGPTWLSDLDGNVWEPGVYGWTQEDAE